MLKIDGNDTATRSIQVGLDIEDGAVVANKVIAGIGCVQQANEWAITIHFAVVEAVLRVGTVPDMQHQVDAIISDYRREAEFFIFGSLVDKLILYLWRA